MAKVRQDRHGVYVKVGGYIFRPVMPSGYKHVCPEGSAFTQGQPINGKHRGGSLIRLRDDEGNAETWHSHGPYMGPGSSPNSEDSFKPDHETW
jgi:hypothetical protein